MHAPPTRLSCRSADARCLAAQRKAASASDAQCCSDIRCQESRAQHTLTRSGACTAQPRNAPGVPSRRSMAPYRLRAIESPANTSSWPPSISRAAAAEKRRAPQARAASLNRQCRCGVSVHVPNSAAVAFVHLSGQGRWTASITTTRHKQAACLQGCVQPAGVQQSRLRCIGAQAGAGAPTHCTVM